MNLSVHDAADALQTADAAGQRMSTLRRYSAFAPFLLVWGMVWLLANVTTDLRPDLSGKAWMAGMLIGFAASLWISIHNFRTKAYGDSLKPSKARAVRSAVTWFAIAGFFWASMWIMAPFSPRQGNAFVSLVVAFLYLLYGVWTGWRIFIVGLVTALAVLFGYFGLKEHYYLWMGLVSGGALILGGLWLRKA